MADITETRNTAQLGSGTRWVRIEVASGETLYHGHIGGWGADMKAKTPGSGVFPVGRICCPNGVKAVEGEFVDIEEGTFSWDVLTGGSFTAIGQAAYAASNHEVDDDAINGQLFGIYVGTFDGKLFFKSGFGVVTLDGT